MVPVRAASPKVHTLSGFAATDFPTNSAAYGTFPAASEIAGGGLLSALLSTAFQARYVLRLAQTAPRLHVIRMPALKASA
jgi:hypothetical protein